MQSRFFLAFDMDGDELISFHEYLLVLVFLGVHVEARHHCPAAHRLPASSAHWVTRADLDITVCVCFSAELRTTLSHLN